MPCVEAIAFKVRVPTLVLFFCIKALGFPPTARSTVIFPPAESNVGAGEIYWIKTGKNIRINTQPNSRFSNLVGSYEITKWTKLTKLLFGLIIISNVTSCPTAAVAEEG